MGEFIEKLVEGSWYDERLKRKIDVYASTCEPLKEPSREDILKMELLKVYPNTEDFEYLDNSTLEDDGSLAVFPEIEIGTAYFKFVGNEP